MKISKIGQDSFNIEAFKSGLLRSGSSSIESMSPHDKFKKTRSKGDGHNELKIKARALLKNYERDSVFSKAKIATASVGGIAGFITGYIAKNLFTDNIFQNEEGCEPLKRMLPINNLSEIGKSISGEVFLLDSSNISAMEVKARQIIHPDFGSGTEFSFRLPHKASMKLNENIRNGNIKSAKFSPYLIESSTFKDDSNVLAPEGYIPTFSFNGDILNIDNIKSCKIEDEGKFTVEYLPRRDIPQVYRNQMRIRIYGGSNVELKNNLVQALDSINLPNLFDKADPMQEKRLKCFSLLRMLSPEKAENLSLKHDHIEIKELENELSDLGVDKERIDNVKFSEVFPGHIAAVDPILGRQYVDSGVSAIMVGIRSIPTIIRVLNGDGLISTIERYSRGIHRPGAALAADEMSGGARSAFGRIITQKAMDIGVEINTSSLSGKLQIISTGDQMKDLISRTDWHAYPVNCYGVTVKKNQAYGPHADEMSRKIYENQPYRYTHRLVLKELIDKVNSEDENGFNADNEICFKRGIPNRAWTHIIVPDTKTKEDLLDELSQAGINNLGEKAIEETVIIAKSWGEVANALGIPIKSRGI